MKICPPKLFGFVGIAFRGNVWLSNETFLLVFSNLLTNLYEL